MTMPGGMKTGQLLASHVDALRELANVATGRAASNLARLVDAPVHVGLPTVRVDALRDASSFVSDLSSRASVACVPLIVDGTFGGDLLLVLPASVERLVFERLSVPRDPELRASARMEVANIVLGGYASAIATMTKLDVSLGSPHAGVGDPRALLDLPLARAASDDDAVLGLDAILTLTDDLLPAGLMHVLFLPAPGTLARLLASLDLKDVDAELQVIVHMGELAVTRRPGDVLVARGLGSCVAVALLDQRAGVAALAHVMLPEAPAPRVNARRQTYPARYAEHAVPALLDALERAGGRRDRARAWVVGGSQMFEGVMDAAQLQINRHNVDLVLRALVEARVPLEGSDVGGTVGRSLEVRISPPAVTCRVPAEGRVVEFLDDVA
jgi:chemotaxis protein CheD